MDKKIQELNTAIAKELTRVFGRGRRIKLYGLAEAVLVRDSDGEATSPAIVDTKGECRLVNEALDRADITIYSRLQNVSYEEDPATSFGSSRRYKQVADLSLVVLGGRQCNKYMVESALCDAILTSHDRTLSNSDFNAAQVWSGEFPGMPYFINPDYFLIKVNYRITTSTNRCTKRN